MKSMLKTILTFSALILSVLALFQLSQWSLLSQNDWTEWLIGGVAVAFFIGGFWWNQKQTSVAQQLSKVVDYHQVQAYQISPREYEVLQQMALSKTNKEIAAALFLSESTIKTHVSSLLQKLNCKNRTEAVEKAIELNLLIIS